MTAETRAGYIYILSHKVWSNLRYPAGAPGIGAVKIGRTGRDPRTRLAEITASSGLVAPGCVEFAAYVDDMAAVERAVQRDLGAYRIRRRELFRVDVETARRAIESAQTRIAPIVVRRPPASPQYRRPHRRRRPVMAWRYLAAGIALIGALALLGR